MNLIPVIKYYKQIGFKLQEMQGVQNNETYFYHERNFTSKLDELTLEEQRIKNCHTAIYDWYNLLKEASMIIESGIDNINLKYLPPLDYYYLECPFDYDYREAVINIPWVNYLEKNNCEITGPVILNFPSFKEKKAGQATTVQIMQQPVGIINTDVSHKQFAHSMYVSMYHIGDPQNISEKYQIIEKWAHEHGYVCGEESYERYVADYWSTTKIEDFVVELLVPVTKAE